MVFPNASSTAQFSVTVDSQSSQYKICESDAVVRHSKLMLKSCRTASYLFICLSLTAQVGTIHAAVQPQSSFPTNSATPPAGDQYGYILGPGDQLSVFVEDLSEEFGNKTFRVDTNGEISLPVIGHVQAGGLSLAGLETELRTRLSNVLNEPHVAISLVNFGSQPISVLGAVNSPGTRQLEGRKTLFEVLSSAGGLRADAGYQVKITRDLKWGRIPLPQAQLDPKGRCSVVSIKLNDIIDATNPEENIAILPGDAISVPRADLVYVVGSVVRPGGFALNEHTSLSALQVISLAEGIQKTADTRHARILRTLPGSLDRTEIALDLKKLMDGKNADVQLHPNDILFIPTSGAKVAEQRTIDIMMATAAAAIYKF